MIECVRICRCAFNQLFICVWSLSLCVCVCVGGGGYTYLYHAFARARIHVHVLAMMRKDALREFPFAKLRPACPMIISTGGHAAKGGRK